MAKVWENRSMEAPWEISKDDTLNSRANKTFGHPPAHKVNCDCVWVKVAWGTH
jgi:hypothetical protein